MPSPNAIVDRAASRPVADPPARAPVTSDRPDRVVNGSIHPLHAFFVAGAVPLFIGAAASDYAYFSTFEIQWINFADWLNVGGLLMLGGVLIALLAGLFRRRRRVVTGLYALLVVASFALALYNAFVHARDAWATMPTALVVSVIVALLAAAAAGLGLSPGRHQRRLDDRLIERDDAARPVRATRPAGATR